MSERTLSRIPLHVPHNLAVSRCTVDFHAASHRILIFQPGLFGEVLMGTPLLAALRATFPNAWLTWVGDRNYIEALDANPYLDELLAWNSRHWQQTWPRKKLASIVRRAVFKRVLCARGDTHFISLLPEQWRAIQRAVPAPVRIGVYDTHREFFGHTTPSDNTNNFTHAFFHDDLPKHRTGMYLLPLQTLGVILSQDLPMTLGFTEADSLTAQRFLCEQHATNQRLVVFAPMTTWKTRCWPVERFIALGHALVQSDPSTRIVVIGRRTPDELPTLEPLLAGLPENRIDAVGKFGFRELAALVAHCQLLISGDTGPMHVAAAVGTPYLALFGPTPANGRAPLNGRGVTLQHAVPCGPCDKKQCSNTGDAYIQCMRLITVDEALCAAEALLTREP